MHQAPPKVRWYCFSFYAFSRSISTLPEQAVGVPTVTVSTLIMAGSLVLVIAPPPGGLAHGGGGEEASMPIWRRPGFIMGALLILLRLIAVSCRCVSRGIPRRIQNLLLGTVLHNKL